MEKKEREELVETRLYSPLSGVFYDAEDYCRTFDGGGLYGYRRIIQEAVEKDWIQETKTGLLEYLTDPVLKERVISLYPSVEGFLYGLWGVLVVTSRGELSETEMETLKDEWHGQMTDGWGEVFWQEAIDCGEGCRLYVDFREAGRNRIRTERELKGAMEEQEGVSWMCLS